jgi:transposase
VILSGHRSCLSTSELTCTLAEVGDVSRFASARKLASRAGLTPTVRVADYGHISKEGSVWLRWVMCEAAQAAKRSPQFATPATVAAWTFSACVHSRT